jgi:hypothetical protein
MGIPKKQGTIGLAGLTVLVITFSLFPLMVASCGQCNSWSRMDSGVTQELEDVWGTSPSDVFAIGRDGIILHFDGTTWTSMNSSTTMPLRDIWGSSSSDVFALAVPAGGGGGAILHYDGTRWSTMDSGKWLRGVWGSSASDVFAVGTRWDGTAWYGTILHYDGTSWTAMETPTTVDDTPVDGLCAVWGSSSSDVFAVGDIGTILHYDGASWNSMDSGIGHNLWDIWGSSASDIYAVALAKHSICHYDGTSWTSIETCTTKALFGVWGSSSSDIFAVGERGNCPPLSEQVRPTIAAIVPDHGKRGETLVVAITSSYLAGASAIYFGEGITPNGFAVDIPSRTTASIPIDDNAAWEPRDISVTTPLGTATLPGSLTIASKRGAAGDCGCKSASGVTAGELMVGWGITGLCLGSSYYLVGKSNKRRKQ